MKHLFVILSLTLQFLPIGFTQDYTQWELPEGASMRLGKGDITGNIAFSPDSTMIAIPSSIGIWLYDARTYKELALVTEHAAHVEILAFSPDGKTLVGVKASSDPIILWDMSKTSNFGKYKTSLKGHTRKITRIAFSSDGQTLASASEDRTVILWNPYTGKNKFTLKGHTKGVRSIAFAPDNSMLASGSNDGTVRLWNAKTGKQILILKANAKTISYREAVYSVAFSPDSRMLVSLTDDGTIRLWDTKTGKHIRKFKGTLNEGYPENNSVSFSPDNRTIVSISDSDTKLWNVRTGKLLWELKGRLHISPDWSLDASTDQDKILLWDMKARKQVTTLTDYKSKYRSLVFSPDGKKIANGLGIWDISTGEHAPINEEHVSTGSSVMFIQEGKTLVSWGNHTPMQLWDTKTGKRIRTFPGDIYAISSDGKTVAGGFKNWQKPPSVQVWDTETGKLKQAFSINPEKGRELLVVSPDGETLVSCRHYSDQIYELWDVVTGEHKLTLNTKPYYVRSVVFSPDSQTLVGLGEKDIPLWNANTGELIATLKGHTSDVRFIVFSPNEGILASASSDETVRLWDTKTYELKATLIGHTQVITSIVFFPDGETVATTGWIETTRLWDTKTEKLKKTLPGHQPVAFFPDGNTLVNISWNTIEFLSTKTWEHKLMLEGPPEQINSVAFSPDGKTMASAGSTILLWKLDSPNLLPMKK